MNMPRFNAEFALSKPSLISPACLGAGSSDGQDSGQPSADADSSGRPGLHLFSAEHIWAADKPNLLCRILYFRPVLFTDLLHPDGTTLTNVTGSKHTFLLNIR